MAGQHTLFQPLKLMAGTALIGLGVFLLLGNLSAAAAQLSHLLGISAAAAKTLGVLTAVGLAAPHALPVYLFDHQAFLRSLCQFSANNGPSEERRKPGISLNRFAAPNPINTKKQTAFRRT